jgi:hypothetical protein
MNVNKFETRANSLMKLYSDDVVKEDELNV